MAREGDSTVRSGVFREWLGDVGRVAGSLIVGSLGILVISVWHRLSPGRSEMATDGGPTATDGTADVTEYELWWYHYLKAIDAHHGPGGSPDRDIETGSALRGLRLWIGMRFLRGYTLGNSVYVCPNAPRVVRVHQLGHAPAFGDEHSTLVYDHRENGGLEDAPLYTFDVMLPGDFPHTFLRFRDPRGLTDDYIDWRQSGRLRRVTGPQSV